MKFVVGHLFGQMSQNAFNRLLVGLGFGDKVVEGDDKVLLRKSLGQGLIVEKETEDCKRENQEPNTNQAEKKIVDIRIGHNKDDCTKNDLE